MLRFFFSCSLVPVWKGPHEECLALLKDNAQSIYSVVISVLNMLRIHLKEFDMARPSDCSSFPGALSYHLSLPSLIIPLSTDSCPLTFKNTQIIHRPPKNTKKYTLILVSLQHLSSHERSLFLPFFYINYSLFP